MHKYFLSLFLMTSACLDGLPDEESLIPEISFSDDGSQTSKAVLKWEGSQKSPGTDADSPEDSWRDDADVRRSAKTHRSDHWYFGLSAGIDFTSGSAIATTHSAMSAFEGSTVASDNQGNLLFYTNGGPQPYLGGVYNRNHLQMPNGDLAGTASCGSAFQSALTVQDSLLPRYFHIFSTDCVENGLIGGLRHAVVDMMADGGLGDVITKDRLITPPGIRVNESLTAIRHVDGATFWVVVREAGTDRFGAYRVRGPNWIESPVISHVGTSSYVFAGTLSASYNGEKIAHSNLNTTYLFDFDAATGDISNPENLGVPSYSNAFSPNCQYLYLADGTGQTLFQLDMTANSIASSAVAVATTSSVLFGELVVGPDEKLYAARFYDGYLGVVDNPDEPAAMLNYQDNGFWLAGQTSLAGLPNFINDNVGWCGPY